MKKCRYCGTMNENAATRCKGCTANDFICICDNCGSEIVNGQYCSRCGVRFGAARRICPNCGTAYYTNACPNCGYTQRRYEEPTVYIADDPAEEDPVAYVPVETPEKNRGCWATFGVVLLWIFFLPIMATIAVWKSKKVPTVFKWIITLLIWGATLLYASRQDSASSASDALSFLPFRFLV